MGNKILRQRLRGPTLAKYYPAKGPTVNTLEKEFRSLGLETENDEEEDRQDHLEGQVACVLILHRIRKTNLFTAGDNVERVHQRRSGLQQVRSLSNPPRFRILTL